jgi:hypothetical protein
VPTYGQRVVLAADGIAALDAHPGIRPIGGAADGEAS